VNVLASAVEGIKERAYGAEYGDVRMDAMPPCMKHWLRRLQEGQNVPHHARFALVAFLRALGMDPEEIMKMFAVAPDFDEEKTRYQVEHITGRISSTEYEPMECSTMKTYGICMGADELCSREWLKHPMQYYRYRRRSGKHGGKGKADVQPSGRRGA